MCDIEPTASLGTLHIDERNCYLGISTFPWYNKHTCQWYKITDIVNPGLYCAKPRMNKRNVLVDCEFVCDVPSQGLHIKKIVKSRICCLHHKYAKDSHYEEWEEPGSISIMRGIINQTYSNAVRNEIQEWANRLRFIEDNLYEQALCAFMLNDTYTMNELQERYNGLSKLYQNTECSKLLQKYYEMLLQKFNIMEASNT